MAYYSTYQVSKFKNELYHLLPKRKKSVQAGPHKTNAKVKKELQRGIVHWRPPSKCGENEESQKIHKTWLQKEFRKSHRDKSGTKELTYPFRRMFINEEKRPIKDVMREYPFYFSVEEEVYIN